MSLHEVEGIEFGGWFHLTSPQMYARLHKPCNDVWLSEYLNERPNDTCCKCGANTCVDSESFVGRIPIYKTEVI